MSEIILHTYLWVFAIDVVNDKQLNSDKESWLKMESDH